MALHQGLYQKLQQKLSPQQIQLMKLLQVPTAALEERIKEEIEENPALELGSENEEIGNSDEEIGSSDNDELASDESGEIESDPFDEYIDDDEIGDYKLKDDQVPELSGNLSFAQSISSSLHESLTDQLRLLNLDPQEEKIAEQIIGSIDDDGYLRRDTNSIVDDLAFKQNIIVEATDVENVITIIQHFEPTGVAARDVQECLTIQLRKKTKDHSSISYKNALRIIEFHFEEFTKRHFDKIAKSLEITEEATKEAIAEIRKLNPRPGGQLGELNKAEHYIIPDFFVYNNAGQLELTLNQKNAPDLKVSSDYKEMLRDYEKGSKQDKKQKEAVLFIKQKIDSAKWFIDAIKQRHANSKFVQTEFGSFRLKYFFSEALSTDSGEEVSTREVKTILNEFIIAEDKKNPLSDDNLTEMLNEKGYNIARRTVAKYREQLNIPVARLRKEL